jgi:outer membrane protein OmpA-like peptidoglycan-associated protein
VALAAPTVTSYAGNDTTPAITGTWPEKDAMAVQHNLNVKLGETTYELGKSPELTSDGAGNWTLVPAQAVAEGSLDVLPSLVGPAGLATVAGAVVGKAMIDLTPPAAPKIMPLAPDFKWPMPITGTWPEEPGNTLGIGFNGVTYDLGKSPELTSDGKGNFSFAPKVDLAPGSYDLDFTVNDGFGNSNKQTLKAAVVIPEPPKAEEPPPPPPAHETATAPVVDAGPDDGVVNGTWDNSHPTHQLVAKFQGREYVLDRGAALSSTEPGKFSFAPRTTGLAPGKYDVEFVTRHTDGTAADTAIVATAAVVVPEPPPPPPPPHEPAAAVTADAGPDDNVVNGTWDNSHPTHQLVAKFQGREYVLDRGAALSTTEPGKFTFAPRTTGLAPGKYDVEFVTRHTDGAAADTSVMAAASIVVPEPPPPPPPPAEPVKIEIPPPTIVSQKDTTGAPIIKGTWPSDVATKLTVTLKDRNYVLGQDANLSVKGNEWSLLPGAAIPDGVYEVNAVAADDTGNSTSDASNNELEVAIPAPPPPPPPAEPYDCLAVMQRITNVFPIRFEYDLIDITRPFELSVSQYAALLKDPRCTSLNIDIVGHADFIGGPEYNVNLSERRANLIMTMLKDAGVDASRMTAKGMGETTPIDPAQTDEARAKNRRVDITAKP